LKSIFTGIVIEKGNIVSIVRAGNTVKLAVKGHIASKKAVLGSSIAVNGICLTVTKIDVDVFEADVMPETVRRSNLASLKPGSLVNLEPALRLGDEMGGHLVTGHIDGVGKILSLTRDENAVWMTIEAQGYILSQIVEKGSVALDGVSLTVAKTENSSFSVSLIPFTAGETVLGIKKVGDTVNIETDIIGKYVEKFVKVYSGEKREGLTLSMLKEHGFA
jgi:riboflavin synthase